MIALTGASGFIGKHVARAVRSRGTPFVCLVRKSGRGDALAAEGFPIREVDFDSGESLTEALKGCQTLVHVLGVINAASEDLFRVNVEYTRRLVKAAQKNGVRKIIFMSSVAAIRRHGPYGESKYQAEEIVRGSGIPFWILRPAFVYGTGDEHNTGMMIRTLRQWPVVPLLGGGSFMLQPVYAGDLVDVIMKMLAMPAAGQACTVAGPAQVSLKEILKTLAVHLKLKRLFLPVPLKPVQFVLRGYIRLFPRTRLPVKQILELDRHEAFDISETRRLFGFEPMPFREGAGKMFGEFPCAG